MPDYPAHIKSKLPKTGTTIFTIMSALAHEHGAINLSQGFPDFLCDEQLIALVEQFMRKGLNQYAPMPGILPLREAIAAKAENLYAAKYHPETEITVTAGGTEAIYAAITAVVEDGDEVIIFEPAYDCYAPSVELNGGVPIYVELEAPDYAIDWNAVKKLIHQRTKMIIINTPHNPSGMVMTAQDMKQLQKLTQNTDIIILSDEVYEHIIFDGGEHQSVMRYPKLAERSFVVFSFGKTYHNTGWKMGYCLAPAELMREFRKAHQFIVFSANTPIQYAFAEMMKDPSHYLGLRAFYEEKRNYFLKLTEGSRFRAKPAAGSYFQMLSYKGISNEKDTDFAVRLTKEKGVAAIPTSVFYHHGVDRHMLRFCFAKEKETLERAAERLQKV
ncbi:MAG: methionine aminotransferase [Chitinophagales bacterium]|nr:methionine aminotransferase [Chitinophagales bacterium]